MNQDRNITLLYDGVGTRLLSCKCMFAIKFDDGAKLNEFEHKVGQRHLSTSTDAGTHQVFTGLIELRQPSKEIRVEHGTL